MTEHLKLYDFQESFAKILLVQEIIKSSNLLH